MEASLQTRDGDFTALVSEYTKESGSAHNFVTFTISSEGSKLKLFTEKEHLHILKETIEQFENKETQ